ncbi:MAG: pyruvate kinase [Anaerolineae bacterium]|nr:pyruvate kinase [Anaerolineae bacterium]
MSENPIRLPDRKTKIVATLGPASDSPAVLEALIANGMDIARLNFSHGDLADHRRMIANVRAAAAKLGRRVAIMGDLPGPKMRIGRLAAEPIFLERDQPFIIEVGDFVGDATRVAMNFARLPQCVGPGDLIYINDGYIQVEVQEVVGPQVRCRVRVGGELRSRKGVNFPGIDLGIRAFTEQDRRFLAFAAEEQLDAISQSFVQDGADIQAVRQAAAAMGYAPFIIAKIERARAADNLEEILDCADGIMVARGDLSVEIPFERIAIVQKQIIQRASLKSRPVITATHMLESMTSNRRPTRAEVTDVANAIIDGTDGVMLSGETSVGQYPADAVAAMSAIARYTEQHMASTSLLPLLEAQRAAGRLTCEDEIALTVYRAVEALQPDILVSITTTGNSVRRLARFDLPVWIVAISSEERTVQQLLFSRGVYPVDGPATTDSWARYVADRLAANGVVARRVLLTESSATRAPRDTTHIEILHLEK